MKINVLIAALLLIGCHSSSAPKPQAYPCKLKPETGACKAYIPKYFFNPQTQKCESFGWGGCGGVVPFDSMEACQKSMHYGISFDSVRSIRKHHTTQTKCAQTISVLYFIRNAETPMAILLMRLSLELF